MERRLAAILAADVVGYSRLMEKDEAGTFERLKALRLELVDPGVRQHKGRIVKLMGDGLLAEFPSAANAVRCGAEIQDQLMRREVDRADEDRIRLRIGVNLGDVIVEGGDIYGEGVNVAARLEGLAEPDGLCVSGAVFETVEGKLQYDFEDTGLHHVKNIEKPVRAYRLVAGSRPRRKLALPEKPSISVLPFDDMSADSTQSYFADGIVEGITAALSRIKAFFVIARTSSFIFKNRAAAFGEVRDALGVHYFLEGSVQRAGDRVRITVQLIETGAGSHVWAERFDGTLSDIFDFQDRITEQVVGAIQPSIRQAEIERCRRKRPQDMTAYDFVMRAMPNAWSLNQEDNTEALRLLNEAIKIDPDYPMALSLAAWCHGQQAVYNWSRDLAATRATAMELAVRAAALNPDDPLVLTVLGGAHTIVNDHAKAGPLLEKAVSLDPNSAWTWARIGWSRTYAEQTDQAIEAFETALRLSPYDPLNFNCYAGMGNAQIIAGDLDAAIVSLERALNEHPQAAWIYRNLVAAYAAAGREDDSRRAADIFMRAYPGLGAREAADAMVFTQARRDWCFEMLVRAGVPA